MLKMALRGIFLGGTLLLFIGRSVTCLAAEDVSGSVGTRQEASSSSSSVQGKGKKGSAAARAARSRGQRIEVGEFTVFGRIVKPRVQFIISREKGTADEALVLKESFVPRILESVRNAPF